MPRKWVRFFISTAARSTWSGQMGSFFRFRLDRHPRHPDGFVFSDKNYANVCTSRHGHTLE